jgi:hypothetical protein
MGKHSTFNVQLSTPNKTFRARRKFDVGRSMLNVECLFIFLTALVVASVRAEEFGDISVSPNAIYTGNTYHGYAETRVLLENRSAGKKHSVTLIYPNNPNGNFGNCISRISRTVSLGPEAREVVSLLQPPLPAQGDGAIRVEVDGRHEGEVRAQNANNHCNYYSRGGGPMAAVFISRTLDFDAVERVFHAGRGAFTAAMATGPPDAVGGRGGYPPTTWMPDTRRGGQTNWLELDYATAQTVNRISVHNMQSPAAVGFISLVGAAGTNLAKLPMSSGMNLPPGSRGAGWITEFTFPETGGPVKTVRMNFERTPPYAIAIDAVEITGPSGSQWAADARASSDNSASASAYAPGRVAADQVESLRAESPVAEWSESWLGYSSFDAVVFNAGDLAAMPPAVFGALGDYLSAGGNIVLAGKTELPAAWHPSSKKSLRDGVQYEVGFGRCFAFAADNLAGIDARSVQALRETVRDTARYWQSLPGDSGAANAVFPVVENLKIPTRGIVVMMLAFIVIIGPVNMIYLTRIKRRTWMLWTIPAISFASTLLVFAYSLMREGITPDTRITGLTVLDQASHHAATVGGTAFYCPLTPSGGLHFDFGTEATPLVHSGYGAGNAREVDWTSAQNLLRGWVSARVPVHFHLRKSETRRERLQVINENGKLQIVNGLGAPIKSLWIADADLNCYQADNVPAGRQAGLIPSHAQPAAQTGAPGILRDLGFAVHFESGAEGYLQPNTYIAVLDGNPFIENALGAAASPKRTKSSSVVFGILENEKN